MSLLMIKTLFQYGTWNLMSKATKIFDLNLSFLLLGLILFFYVVTAVLLLILVRRRQKLLKARRKMSSQIQLYKNESSKKAKQLRQIVHDLRAPIAATLSLSRSTKEICKKRNIDEEDKSKLAASSELTQKCMERLSALCDGILDSSQSYPGTYHSFQKMLDQLLNEFQSNDAYHNLNFVNETKGYDFWIEGDSNRIFRVFQNIIKNAAEAMSFKGDIKISHGRRMESMFTRRQSIQIVVADTGPGLTKREIKKLLSSGFSKKKDGHGIGLQVVKETIYAQKGKIQIKSKPGVGTQFMVELPVH